MRSSALPSSCRTLRFIATPNAATAPPFRPSGSATTRPVSVTVLMSEATVYLLGSIEPLSAEALASAGDPDRERAGVKPESPSLERGGRRPVIVRSAIPRSTRLTRRESEEVAAPVERRDEVAASLSRRPLGLSFAQFGQHSRERTLSETTNARTRSAGCIAQSLRPSGSLAKGTRAGEAEKVPELRGTAPAPVQERALPVMLSSRLSYDGNGYTNRRMNASALSATSRQPLSITRPWPRFGISTISVTPSFSFCFL